MTEPSLRAVADVMRDEMVVTPRIAALVRDGPRTIPELAVALEYPSQEVVFWVMAMCRYGTLVPTGKAGEDGYYRYRLSEENPVPTE
jgi:hypothetical protein